MHRIYRRIAALLIGLLIAALISVGEWAKWEVLSNTEMVASAVETSSSESTLKKEPPDPHDQVVTQPVPRHAPAAERPNELGTAAHSPAPQVKTEPRPAHAAPREFSINMRAAEGALEEKLLGDPADPTPQQRASPRQSTPEHPQAREPQGRGPELGRAPQQQPAARKLAETTQRKAPDQARRQRKARSMPVTSGDAQALIGQLARAKTAKEAIARLAALRNAMR